MRWCPFWLRLVHPLPLPGHDSVYSSFGFRPSSSLFASTRTASASLFNFSIWPSCIPGDALCLPGCGSRSLAGSPRLRPVPHRPTSAAVDPSPSSSAATSAGGIVETAARKLSTPRQASSFCTEEICSNVVGASLLLERSLLVDVRPNCASMLHRSVTLQIVGETRLSPQP